MRILISRDCCKHLNPWIYTFRAFGGCPKTALMYNRQVTFHWLHSRNCWTPCLEKSPRWCHNTYCSSKMWIFFVCFFVFIFCILCSVTPFYGFTSYMTGFCWSWMFLSCSIIFQLKLHDIVIQFCSYELCSTYTFIIYLLFSYLFILLFFMTIFSFICWQRKIVNMILGLPIQVNSSLVWCLSFII